MTCHWKELLLEFGNGAMASIGLQRFLHSRLYKNQLSILMYHAVVRKPLAVPDWCFVDEKAFRKQIAYLKQSFRVVPLSHAVEMLAAGPLVEPTVAITFDDGYQNNYDIAFPILAAYECPSTIFLTTKYIDSDEIPWFGRLNLALTLTAKTSLLWDGGNHDISTAAQKSRTGVALHHSLKRLHPYSIEGVVADICRSLDVDTDQKFDAESCYHMLRKDAIRIMTSSGLIEFGAHTHSHSILSRLSPDQSQAEILNSLRLVEQFTGKTCTLFAYPNGSQDDYDLSSIDSLKSSGVRAAVSTVSGPNSTDTPPLELRRYGVGSDLNFSGFQSLVHHATYRMQQVTWGRRHVHA